MPLLLRCLPLYALSIRLGLRHLLRRGYHREALARVLVPIEPSRYLEFPEALAALDAEAGERVLDLASPKLVAVHLAGRGVEVTSVDQLASEVEVWRRLAEGHPGVTFAEADGRSLPFADAHFSHAYSISVLEHVPEDGDERALRELARVVRPGGRVVLTLPYAQAYREDWRDQAVYGDDGRGRAERHFFARWYDDERIERLLAAVPALEPAGRRVANIKPLALERAYVRWLRWLLPLAPFFGLVLREDRRAAEGMIRLTLVRRG